MAEVNIKLQALPHFAGLEIPKYESLGAAGLDIRAAIDEDKPITLKPGERCLVPSGLKMEIPLGYEVQVRPRSGLAFKHGVTLVNTPGTIDSDYRGEVSTLMINLGQVDFIITRGERVAQWVIAPVVQTSFTIVDELSDTARGTGGYGSTGKK
ncbi:MAG: dUTP diphosphatase [Alphaproteobacteria bacterium]|nr:dUTP diphosphatase [Alphaproteobacteria bacterium]